MTFTARSANGQFSIGGNTFANDTNFSTANALLYTVTANGSIGTNGQVLTSDGANVYWANAGFANGSNLTGNTITANLVVANVITVNTITANIGFQNRQIFDGGSFSTNASLNMIIAGPFTIATGNTFIVTAGSRVVIV